MNTTYVAKALLTEFVGTFLLVLVVGCAVAQTAAQGGTLVGSALAYGLALMTLIYIWNNFSGAHYNPAVSFGFAVSGQMHWGLMVGYWIAQLLGGIAAGALISYFYAGSNSGASLGSLIGVDNWKAFLVEAFFTFILVLAYLFIYRNPVLALASGLAIGMVVAFAMLAVGPLTGASLNPARTLGPAIFNQSFDSYWVYALGPLVGALFAALVYKIWTKNFQCKTAKDKCGKALKDSCGNNLLECKKPVLDNCGKPVLDCNKKPVMRTHYIKDVKYTHHQTMLGDHQVHQAHQGGSCGMTERAMSPRAMSPRAMSSRAMTPRMVSQRSASPRSTSPRMVSQRSASPRSTSPRMVAQRSASPRSTSPRMVAQRSASPRSTSPRMVAQRSASPRSTSPRMVAQRSASPRMPTPGSRVSTSARSAANSLSNIMSPVRV